MVNAPVYRDADRPPQSLETLRSAELVREKSIAGLAHLRIEGSSYVSRNPLIDAPAAEVPHG
jgi:hypothetical protein